MNIGIIGHAADKFSPPIANMAKRWIREIMEDYHDPVIVSGGCHLGGVDIWAEEIAAELSLRTQIFRPLSHTWSGVQGYQFRNMRIAETSDIVHVIVVAALPPGYTGMAFPTCYHCKTSKHVKSGACWTARQAMKLGKRAEWHVL